ncbi:MAG: hydrogenase maturation protease [Planctomycetota bacterium]
MKPTVRVIGLGQRVAGDDGVGLAVVDELCSRGVADDVDLVAVSDASDLPWLLGDVETVVMVDAASTNGPSGQVLQLSLDELRDAEVRPVSTHGLGVVAAVELANLLNLSTAELKVHVVCITIEQPREFTTTLSSRVSAAVPVAVDLVFELIGGKACTNPK